MKHLVSSRPVFPSATVSHTAARFVPAQFSIGLILAICLLLAGCEVPELPPPPPLPSAVTTAHRRSRGRGSRHRRSRTDR